MPGWLKFLLIIIVLPILVGAIVLLVAGRPVAFEILQRRIAARFPEVKWISTQDLGRWQDDAGQPQPLILDARSQPEVAVSHLRAALPIDPYTRSTRALRGAGPSEAPGACSSAGYRGARVTSWINRAGYTRVVNLWGGLFKWANEGGPMIREENRATPRVHPYDRRWG